MKGNATVFCLYEEFTWYQSMNAYAIRHITARRLLTVAALERRSKPIKLPRYYGLSITVFYFVSLTTKNHCIQSNKGACHAAIQRRRSAYLHSVALLLDYSLYSSLSRVLDNSCIDSV